MLVTKVGGFPLSVRIIVYYYYSVTVVEFTTGRLITSRLYAIVPTLKVIQPKLWIGNLHGVCMGSYGKIIYSNVLMDYTVGHF